MVKHVRSSTSLTRSGVSDWLVQRVSALILLAYVIFLLGFYFGHPTLDYLTWHGLFLLPAMRIFSFLTLLALLGHAWVGMWTVLTDYVKPYYLRGILQIFIILAFIACLAFGVTILWS